MAEIKLFVSCHRIYPVPEHSLLVPVQVGAALAHERFPGFLQDDDGVNISKKNRTYCELTAQYWAWKNIQADYYGFFQYRRYLYPDETAKLPYRLESMPTMGLLNKIGYEHFPELISRYDLILPKREDMHISVREHYAEASFHHEKDLKLVEKIVKEIHPEYAAATEEYLSGTMCYFGNIFVMSKLAFEDYCSWLFPILEEFDRRASVKDYSAQELRVVGYLAERLLGIWAMHHQELRQLELPRVHFIESATERWRKKLIFFLLPPGSIKRAKVKEWKRRGEQ